MFDVSTKWAVVLNIAVIIIYLLMVKSDNKCKNLRPGLSTSNCEASLAD